MTPLFCSFFGEKKVEYVEEIPSEELFMSHVCMLMYLYPTVDLLQTLTYTLNHIN